MCASIVELPLGWLQLLRERAETLQGRPARWSHSAFLLRILAPFYRPATRLSRLQCDPAAMRMTASSETLFTTIMCVVAAMGEHDQLVIRLRRDAAEAVAEAEDARAAMQKNERQRSHDAAMQRAREADLQMQARGACQPASQLRRAPSGPARLGGGASRGARRALRGTQGVLSDPGSSADAAAASASSTCGNFHTAAPPAECRPAGVCLFVCMFVCLRVCFLPQTQQLTEQLASKESAIRKLTESAGAKEDRVRRPAAPPASALAGDWVRLATTSAPGLGSPRCRICAGTGSPRRPI